MENILRYLKENIDPKAQMHKWNAKDVLSLQLAASYEFFLVRLLDEEFLLVRPYELLAVSKMQIQIQLIEKKAVYPVAVFLEETTPYRVKKMLEERIPFVAINQQMYLPFMAMHIRKQRKMAVGRAVHNKFTPATQLIYLAILYLDKDNFSIEELAAQLGLSSMTVIRGTDELRRIGLIDFIIGGQTGRKKVFTRIPLEQYYHIGKKYLQNPIKKTIYVKEIPAYLEIYKSGLTALGEQTMLGEPTQEVFAIDSVQEKALKEVEITEEQALEENLPQIQVIKYDVGALTDNEYVDPLTLILSLQQKDERIEIAIEELMEDKKWFAE